jgi:hypothetical protein
MPELRAGCVGITQNRGSATARPSSASLSSLGDSIPRLLTREVLILDALAAVLRLLREPRGSAYVRELRTQARFYENAVKRWTTVPATSAQVGAMFDLVTELHDKVVGVVGALGTRRRSGTR